MNPDFKLTANDIKFKQENALELFYSGIKSQEYKISLERNLKYFLIKVCSDLLEGDFEQRSQQFVNIAREDQTKAKNIVMAYVRFLVERTKLDKTDSYYIRPSYIPNKIKPIQKLLNMNDIGLLWKRIRALYPEMENTHNSRAYTRDEIKRLLAYADGLDIEFVILAASSGGPRNAAWDGIKWGDILPVYQINGQYKIELNKGERGKIVCAAMTVYSETDSQYQTLISIEAWKKLQEYKFEWKRKMKLFPIENVTYKNAV